MSYAGLLFFYFFLSHLVSFLCSILEAALLSCTPSYLPVFSKENPSQGETLKYLKTNIDKPLAAILTFNTAAHTFGAAGIGATVKVLYGDAYVAVASIIVTLTMLYFTEMIPKTIGAIYWKQLLPLCLPIITFMIKVSYPFVISFEAISKWIGRGKKHQSITELEIKGLIEYGTISGILENSEQKMVFRIFKLADSKAKDFMLNRKDVCWIDCESSEEEIKGSILEEQANIYFICKEGNDHPIGYAYASDILHQVLNKDGIDVSLIKRKPFYVPENATVLSLLETFNAKKEKVSFVVDEYGGIAGVVQLEDILNEVVKDICSSIHLKEPLIVKKREDKWIMDGSLTLSDLKEALPIEISPEIVKSGYHTLAGFCLVQLQTIPKVGDEFFYGGFEFKIVEMEQQRISKVMISKIA